MEYCAFAEEVSRFVTDFLRDMDNQTKEAA
jgi:hypothetical protein